MEDILNITIEAGAEAVISFYSILQKGFLIYTDTGISIKDFLVNECMIDDAYIDSKIKTIFLDGHPVDDYRKAVVRDGNVLSLSGPMPGLVGAVLRAGSHYSSFRSGITYCDDEKGSGSCRGMIVLKLFNIIMSDLGKSFLGRGIYYSAIGLNKFFLSNRPDFRNELKSITVNSKQVDIKSFMNTGLAPDDSSMAFLKVEAV